MALTKVTYTNNVTVIGAENLNDIQDEIIANASSIGDLEDTADTLETSIEGLEESKADKMGEYDGMLTGYAKDLLLPTPTTDTSPYSYRTSTEGMVYPTLVGGTVVWNQLVQNGDFADSTKWSANVTLSMASNVASLSFSAGDKPRIWQNIGAPTLGHKLIIMADFKQGVANTGQIRLGLASSASGGSASKTYDLSSFTANTWTRLTFWRDNTSSLGYICLGGTSSTTAVESADTWQIRNFQLIDLTQMFGTTIADYVYSLEQATEGSGIAWLKSYGFFTEDYYAYNAGELVSANPSARKVVGKNLFQTTFTSKTINGTQFTVNTDGSVTISGTPSANIGGVTSYFGSVTLPVGTYKASGCSFDGSGRLTTRLNVFNASTSTELGRLYNGNDEVEFTLTEPAEISLRPIVLTSFSGTATFYPMIRLATETDGTYEPYKLTTYPLGSDTLRGVYKLSGSNLYCDGDVKTADGVIQRKYGIVDLGSLTWVKRDAVGNGNRFSATLSTIKNDNSANLVCKYEHLNSTLSGNTGISVYSSSVYIYDDSLATVSASEFKTAMSGVYLVYELATSTTESSTAFQSPQLVGSTEEIVSDVPCGQESKYYESLTIPNPPSADGTYTLTATVSNGQTTYSWGA